jgi:hypothetical protein
MWIESDEASLGVDVEIVSPVVGGLLEMEQAGNYISLTAKQAHELYEFLTGKFEAKTVYTLSDKVY